LEGLVLVDRQLVEEISDFHLQRHVHAALQVKPQVEGACVDLLKPLAVVLPVFHPLLLGHVVHFVADVQVLHRGKEVEPAQPDEEDRKSNFKAVPLHRRHSFNSR
jgi:hypothetical protein